jgi:hypothetical protein
MRITARQLARHLIVGVLAAAAATGGVAGAEVPQPAVQDLIYPGSQVVYQVDLSGDEAVRHVTENLDQRGGAAALAAGMPLLQPAVTALKAGIGTFSHLVVLAVATGPVALDECLPRYVRLFEECGWTKAMFATVGDSSVLVMLAPEGKGLLLLFCDTPGDLLLEMATGSKPFGDIITEVARAGQGLLDFLFQSAIAGEAKEPPAQ